MHNINTPNKYTNQKDCDKTHPDSRPSEIQWQTEKIK